MPPVVRAHIDHGLSHATCGVSTHGATPAQQLHCCGAPRPSRTAVVPPAHHAGPRTAVRPCRPEDSTTAPHHAGPRTALRPLIRLTPSTPSHPGCPHPRPPPTHHLPTYIHPGCPHPRPPPTHPPIYLQTPQATACFLPCFLPCLPPGRLTRQQHGSHPAADQDVPQAATPALPRDHQVIGCQVLHGTLEHSHHAYRYQGRVTGHSHHTYRYQGRVTGHSHHAYR